MPPGQSRITKIEQMERKNYRFVGEQGMVGLWYFVINSPNDPHPCAAGDAFRYGDNSAG